MLTLAVRGEMLTWPPQTNAISYRVWEITTTNTNVYDVIGTSWNAGPFVSPARAFFVTSIDEEGNESDFPSPSVWVYSHYVHLDVPSGYVGWIFNSDDLAHWLPFEPCFSGGRFSYPIDPMTVHRFWRFTSLEDLFP